MSRTLSLTYGRPLMISQRAADAVPIPAAIDDEYLSEDPKAISRQPADKFPLMAFFPESLKLYRILSSILLTLYTPADDSSPTDIYGFYFGERNREGFSNVFELDGSLTRWARDLPPFLKPGMPESVNDPIVYRQANVLHARCVQLSLFNAAEVKSHLPGQIPDAVQIPPHPYASLPPCHVALLYGPRQTHCNTFSQTISFPINRGHPTSTHRPSMLHHLRKGRPGSCGSHLFQHLWRQFHWPITSMVV